MPFKDFNTKTAFDEAYSIRAERLVGGHPATRPEVRLGYTRLTMAPFCAARAEAIPRLLQWTPPGPSVLWIGSGFAWTVEYLEAAGYDRIVALDTSAWVHEQKARDESADVDPAIAAVGLDPTIGEGAALRAKLMDGGPRVRTRRGVLDEDLTTHPSRGRVRQALGLAGNQRAEWAVTESIMENLTDAEAIEVSTRLHVVATAVVHLVPPTSPPYEANHNPLEAWKALIPGDTWMLSGSFQVL